MVMKLTENERKHLEKRKAELEGSSAFRKGSPETQRQFDAIDEILTVDDEQRAKVKEVPFQAIDRSDPHLNKDLDESELKRLEQRLHQIRSDERYARSHPDRALKAELEGIYKKLYPEPGAGPNPARDGFMKTMGLKGEWDPVAENLAQRHLRRLQATDAFKDRNHPQHKDVVGDVTSLYEVIYGTDVEGSQNEHSIRISDDPAEPAGSQE